MKATVRVRLTALFAGLFIGTTTMLLLIVNLLLKRVLDETVGKPEDGVSVVAGQVPSPRWKYIDDPAERAAAVNAAKGVRATVLQYQWGMTWIAVAVLAVVGVIAGWWLAGRMLRPLHQITATAQRLSLSNLDERIGLTGPRDELRELADTFDAMLERLEHAVDGQRRFIANTSHELRTPLAIQRAAIEIGLADPVPDHVVRTREKLLRANLRTEKLIDGLLMLAQGERTLDIRTPVELDQLASEVAEQHHEAAVAAKVTIELELEPVTVGGDPVLLARLVANLVNNAIRYNRPGGRVRVLTSSSGLTVWNTGPELPADRVPELFEPFRRLHAPRTGTAEGAGLGLSIVAAIASAHGARATADPNPGGGLTVRLVL